MGTWPSLCRTFPLCTAALSLLLCCCLSGCGERPQAQAGALPGPAAVDLTPAAALSVEPAPEARRMLWMAAVGDIMLDRSVGKRIRANGPESILAKVRDQLRAPDLTFANLECPLSKTGPHDPVNCSFRADPATVKVLVDGGIDVVSLANNHTLNAGREGVLNTLDCLDESNIAYVGANRERERSWEPVIFRVGGLKVAFLAYTDLSFEHGSYCKIDENPEAVMEQVRRTDKRCDVLFVSVHWGEEYQSKRSDRQRKTALALIDAGADCILGHHPHTLQGIGIYKNRPILYSMGNFVFDQREGERMESALFELWWKEGGQWQVKATPIWIERSRLGPIYPEKERALKIARRLRDLSRDLGTPAEIAGSRVVVRIDPAIKARASGTQTVAANPDA
ncbi:MAG: CapA family protein [Armatimonadetes bacterium]|nr:CapA family protein [Armatimonadota bacterium]